MLREVEITPHSGDSDLEQWRGDVETGCDGALVSIERLGKPLTSEEALFAYSNRFGDEDLQEELGFDRQAFPWHQSEDGAHLEISRDKVKAELEKDMGLEEGALDTEKPLIKPSIPAKVSADAKSGQQFVAMNPFYNFIRSGTAREEDSDGEDVVLCQQCNLPLGEIVYSCMHGECMAQVMVKDMRNEEQKRLVAERHKKDKRHEEYGIGWRAKFIPRNQGPAAKLTMREVPEGMMCLVYDVTNRSISLASTTEPAAAVSLEYLSTALEVRRREGHEPVFSLDPIGPDHGRHAMQEKVFSPDWLACTAAGEVLFQADYHLKELSMGEYEQPVVGMKSCFDISDSENNNREQWAARQWFVVRKAEVHICDSVLIPFLKMGVEAREQAVKNSRLADKLVTRPDHPMVKYAESFTRNFDLIAERKSVFHHLRQLAKASVMAKHLLESHAELNDSWFTLASETDFLCCMEIPQLWNERLQSLLQLKDGAVLRNGNSNSTMHGVYGGVKFGLEKFNLSAAHTARGRTMGPAAGLTALSTARLPGARRLTAAAKLSTMSAVAPMDLPRPASAQFALTRMAVASQPLAGAMKPRGRLPAAGLSTQAALSRMPGAAVSAAAPGVPAGAVSLAARVPRPSPLAGLAASLEARAEPLGFTRKPGLAPSSMVEPVASLRSLQSGQFAGAHRIPPQEAILPSTAHGISPSTTLGISAAPPAALVGMPPPSGFMPPMSAALGRLQGVDLRLDSFDLSEAKHVSLETQSGSWCNLAMPLEECLALGYAFWRSLESDASPFREGDQALLHRVFNPCLSDRRMEGDLFVPPDASYSHVAKLRVLLKEEDVVREQRQKVFFSKDFMFSKPGSLFPSSWTSKFEVAQGEATMGVPEGRPIESLKELPEYKSKAKEMLQNVLNTAAPMFEKSTEEGMRFRIYRLGSLEVRTTKEDGSDENIGAIFSIRDPKGDAILRKEAKTFQSEDRIIKATEYVERVHRAGAAAGHRRYYVVCETEHGRKVLSEHCENGEMIFDVDPDKLEERNSLAKVLRSKECDRCIRICDLKFQIQTVRDDVSLSHSACKNWARSIYAYVTGGDIEARTKKEPNPAVLAQQKEEHAKKLAQNQALAERDTSLIPLPRSPIMKMPVLACHERA
jgi:hypothetical protein